MVINVMCYFFWDTVYNTQYSQRFLLVAFQQLSLAHSSCERQIITYIHIWKITRCIVEDGSNQRRGLLLDGGVSEEMEEKENVFNLRLNVLMVGAFLTERGIEFQMKTDDQEKASWPIVRLVRG